MTNSDYIVSGYVYSASDGDEISPRFNKVIVNKEEAIRLGEKISKKYDAVIILKFDKGVMYTIADWTSGIRFI